MSNDRSEIERLQRLRQRQLQARDPLAKQRAIERRVTARRRRMRRQVSYLDLITDVPRKWQGLILGLLIGMALWLGINLLVEAAWEDIVGLGVTIALPIVGFYFGQALDVRDELRDLVGD